MVEASLPHPYDGAAGVLLVQVVLGVLWVVAHCRGVDVAAGAGDDLEVEVAVCFACHCVLACKLSLWMKEKVRVVGAAGNVLVDCTHGSSLDILLVEQLS